MDKFFKIIQWILGAIVNLVLLLGILVIILWIGWGITPQTSITKTAYFLSESWALVTGQKKEKDKTQIVREEQLKDSAARTIQFKKY